MISPRKERPISLSSIEDEEARLTLPLLQSRYHELKQEIELLTTEQKDVHAQFRTLADRISARKVTGTFTRIESMRGTIKPELLLERVPGMTPEMIEECTEYTPVSYYLIAPPQGEEESEE